MSLTVAETSRLVRDVFAGAAASDTRLFDLERFFELEFFLSDAMRFIPVKFSFANRTIGQPYGGDSLHFAPLSAPMLSVKTAAIAHFCSRSDRLDVANLAEDLELHSRSLPDKSLAARHLTARPLTVRPIG